MRRNLCLSRGGALPDSLIDATCVPFKASGHCPEHGILVNRTHDVDESADLHGAFHLAKRAFLGLGCSVLDYGFIVVARLRSPLLARSPSPMVSARILQRTRSHWRRRSSQNTGVTAAIQQLTSVSTRCATPAVPERQAFALNRTSRALLH